MEQPISRVRRALDPFRRTDLRKSKRTAAVAGIVVPLIWVGGAIVCLAYLEAAIAVPTATLLFASLLLRIGNMLHEAAHSTFTRYKPLNDLAGEVFAVITLNCFPTYRYEHGTHHLHLGNYVLDCDFNALAKLGYEQAIHSIWTIFWWFLKTLNPTQFAKTYLPKTFWWTEASAREKTFRCIYYGMTIGVTVAWPILGATWFAATFIVAPMLKSWRDIIDHAGLYIDSPHGTLQTRNFIVVNPIIRWIFWPRNDCYHLVHHLAPYLPIEYLHQAHTKLKAELPEYAELPHFAVERLIVHATPPLAQAGE